MARPVGDRGAARVRGGNRRESGVRRGTEAQAHGDHHKVKAHIKHGTLVVKGTEGDDQISLRLRAGDPSIVEVVTQDGIRGHNKLRRERFDAILVEAAGGNDRVSIDETNGVFTDTETTTIDGGEGNDELLGGRGNETFHGAAGNDTVDGNQGADAGFLGEGDDTFIWDNGDGSDVVEGDDGFDTMVFNGVAGSETFDASANGGRLRFFRAAGQHRDGRRRHRERRAECARRRRRDDRERSAPRRMSSRSGSISLRRSAATPVTARPTRSPSTERTRTDIVDIAGANGSASVGGLAALDTHRQRRAGKRHADRERSRWQ